MRVGIITITDGANYGNRLQNYAMHELLKKIGVEAVTISRKTERDLSAFVIISNFIKDIVKVLLGRKNTYFLYRKRKKDLINLIKNI